MNLTIIGSGFVGQATGKGLAKHGHNVLFVDTDTDKLAALKREGYATQHRDSYDQLTSDITFITVPTPSGPQGIQLDFLLDAVTQTGLRLRNHDDYHLVVVRSTVVPHTVRKRVIPLIERVSGKKAGRDFGVCMQPEFLRQASAQSDFDRPWLILIGELDERSGKLLADLHAPFNAPIERTTIEEAEMEKYIHNVFNAVKIAFFNEMRQLCQEEALSSERIFPLVAKSSEAIWNPVYGLRDFGPFDGACLPKDTHAFLHWVFQNGHSSDIVMSAFRQNERYAQWYARQQSRHEAPHERTPARHI